MRLTKAAVYSQFRVTITGNLWPTQSVRNKDNSGEVRESVVSP